MAIGSSAKHSVTTRRGAPCRGEVEGGRGCRISKLALAIGALLPAAGVFAAEAPQSPANGRAIAPPVVVTATRIEQSSFDLPVSIDVIGGEAIQSGQYQVNTSEALNRVPGIFAPNQYRYSSDQQVSTRGFGARSAFGVRGIRLYADGIPQSMPDGQGQTGTFNLSSAARIEVMRGPFSALYGNSSGGVIQIFTKDGPAQPTLTASAYAGSYDTWRANVQAGGQQGALNYLVDVSRFATDGYRQHSAARRDQLNGKFVWQAAEATRLTLVVDSVDQPFNDDPLGLSRSDAESDPRQAIASAFQFNTGGSKSQTHAGVLLEHRVDARNSINAVAYAGARKSLQRLAIPFNATAVVKGSGGVSIIDRDFGGLDARWNHKLATALGPLTLTAGAAYEHMKDVRTGYENANGAQGVLRRDEDNIVWNFDQYLQAEWQLGADWVVSGGVRHSNVRFENKDRYIRNTGVGNPDDSGRVSYSKTNPVVGVLYHLTPSVNLYANAGRGFETPSFIELAYRSGGQSGLNFALQPMTSRNLEAGLKAYVGASTSVNLAVFNIKSQNEIVVDTNISGRQTYRNAGKTGRDGIELAIDSELATNLKAHIAWSLLDARFTESFVASSGTVANGNRLPGAPRSTFFAELAWRHPASGFSTALEARHSGKVYVDDINSDTAAGYNVYNWRGAFEQRIAGLSISEFLRIDNLTDKRYIGSVLVNDGNQRFFAPAPERSYLLGVSASYRF